MNNTKEEAIKLHEQHKGKIEIHAKIPLTKDNLRLLYTPGVAEVSTAVANNEELSYLYTNRGNSIAIITNGTAVVGLGDIGPTAALPVMEGKALLYKELANVDAIPLCFKATAEELIEIIPKLAPTFGGIHIEDVKAPGCFKIIEHLRTKLGIPIFSDDYQCTAVTALGGLINALNLVHKQLATARIVVLGAGAAGYGIAELLVVAGARHLRVVDSKGIISPERTQQDSYKEKLATMTNTEKETGTLETALTQADVLIAVSGKANIITEKHIKLMNKEPIIFALTNPYPEILPEEAKKYGAAIVATGSSLYPNQVNNVQVFPALLRGTLDAKATQITNNMLLAAAHALAASVKHPDKEHIVPGLAKETILEIAKAVEQEAIKEKIIRH